MSDRLLRMLPAFYRLRDAEGGDVLKRFLSVIEEEYAALEGGVDRAYDNWFIETCEEPYVPLIGALLGVRPLHPVSDATYSQRAWVANAIGWRRRKGTAATLEALARDVTGWPSQVIEYFERLVVSWNGMRPGLRRHGPASVRDAARAELASGVFGLAPRTVDVRSIVQRKGRHNIPNVGVHLWRLRSHPPLLAHARPAADPSDGRYSFNPFGLDAPLFNAPPALPEGARCRGERAVPVPLRRLALHDDLEAMRQADVDGSTSFQSAWFGAEPAFRVYVYPGGVRTLVPAQEVAIADLPNLDGGANWPRPPATRAYRRASDGASVTRNIRVAVDPVRGRLAFRADDPARNGVVEVSCSRGFSGELGGGSYSRPDPRAALGLGAPTFTRAVDAPEALAAALGDWNGAAVTGTVGFIELRGSFSVSETLPPITIPAGARLLLAASDRERPHLRGGLNVHGAPTGASAPSALLLDGLFIEGDVAVGAGDLGELTLSHCTLAARPGSSSELVVTPPNHKLRVRISRSILSQVTIGDEIEELLIEDSVAASRFSFDDGGVAVEGDFLAAHIDAPEAPVRVARSTLFAACTARRLDASDSIFAGAVDVERAQEGCVRFCYVAEGSRVPRKYRCAEPPTRPVFTSRRYRDPGFAQLGAGAPAAITAGASNGAEMGAFNLLMQPQRDANLAASLDEYLRYGLEAGIFHET